MNATCANTLSAPRPKLVVLRPDSMVFEAARAMQDNHVGAVLVADHGRLAGILTDRDVALAVARDGFDARSMPLAAIMTNVVGTCDERASVADVVTTMRQYACRRVPLSRDGHIVGLVTLDDLVLEQLATYDDARAVIRAQLERPARLKPDGLVRPSSHHAEPARDEQRRAAVRGALQRSLLAIAGVGSPERADAAARLALSHLCRRLGDDGTWLAAQLGGDANAAVGQDLDAANDAPEAVTLDSIAEALEVRLGILPDATLEILLAVCDAGREVGGERISTRLRTALRQMSSDSAALG